MPSSNQKSNARLKKRRQARHQERLDQDYGKAVDDRLARLECTHEGQVHGTEYDLVEDDVVDKSNSSAGKSRKSRGCVTM